MFELIFIPAPGMGHLASTVEMANVLVTRDHRLSVTILAMKLPYDVKVAECIESLSTSFAGKNIQFNVLPEPPLPEESKKDFIVLVESYKPYVREVVTNFTAASAETSLDSPRLVGLVIDMFCTTMIDVANEVGAPCYVFYTCSASFLAFSLHLQELYEENGSNEVVEQLLNSDNSEITLPNFVNPIPSKLIPSLFSNKDKAVWFHNHIKRFRFEIKGILINTFVEMESHMVKSYSQVLPSLYFVGPVLHLKNTGVAGSSEAQNYGDVLDWLDDQPPSSVVLVCFGTMVSFDEAQVVEIANALEESGVRFIWSLRQPPPKGKFEAPRNYTDIKDILPEGFLDRTTSVGRVVGWTSQAEILGHPAIGGFVSHCGWNSILESVWHGVPMATWPMHAEQQFNAFEMVVELGLAVEVTLDYRITFGEEKPRLVSAEEIKRGIKKLMGSEEGDEVRKKVKARSEESRKSVMEGGSSFISLGKFIDDVLANSQGGGN